MFCQQLTHYIFFPNFCNVHNHGLVFVTHKMFLKLISNVEFKKWAPFESYFWILCWSIFWGCHANIGSCFKHCRLGLLNQKEWKNISDSRRLKRTRGHGRSRGVSQVPGKFDWRRIDNNTAKPNPDWGIFPGRFVVNVKLASISKRADFISTICCVRT